ncbi:DUF72 domain-containing protein [Planctomycetota bacterium]
MAVQEVIVGTAGWSYDDWNNVVYPASQRDKLRFLSQYVDCIEINTSFYRPVTAKTAQKWLFDVEESGDFRFTAKLWRRFTHETDTPFARDDVRVFEDGLKPLAESGKLLGLLVQFPFFFRDSKENREILDRIAGAFPDHTKILEVRDESWSGEEAVAFVKRLGYSVTCLDMPLAANSFKERSLVIGSLGYLRLHGRNRNAWFSKKAGRDEKYDYLYTDEELDGIIDRILEMKSKTDLLVVVWNNHFRGKAVANAVQARARLSGEKVDVPEKLIAAYPQLEPIAKPEKGTLFS